MAVSWTDEQKQAISLRDRNLLVSAAAGSGKTTVLVERILERINDPEEPTDIDRLLIVTFTKAAASEMRSRISKSISERLKTEGDNRHLRRQLTLLNRAQISTIDSFCSYILKNYYQEIGLDPSFRVGDEAEIQLLKEDVLKEVLEKNYAGGNETFLHLSETLAPGKTDDMLADKILTLYDYSRSAPYPDRWLEESLENYRVQDEEAILKTRWCRNYTKGIRDEIEGAILSGDRMLKELDGIDCPDRIKDFIKNEIGSVREAADFSDYREAQERLASVSFDRFPAARKTDNGSPEGRKTAKDLRDAFKAEVTEVRKKCEDDLHQAAEISRRLLPDAEEYVRVTREFASAFAEAKQERNLLDYPDLEHFSIRILLRDGEPTEAARQLSSRFDEILIDEYQDSNYVQEEILTAVSRIREGKHNIFMVGDMKQSIYRFRMARPELFTSKYETYSRTDSDCQLVELPMNFRSSKPVIDAVNFLFSALMQKRVGGIEYDENAELKTGPQEDQEKEKSELFDRKAQILLYTDEQEERLEEEDIKEEDGQNPDAEDEDTEAYDELNGEARMVASEIERLVSGEEPAKLLEKDGSTRQINYGDIVILLRSAKNYDTVFAQALEERGIPVYVESREGYFKSFEVRLVLDLLRIIDNPIQDIPLASVMHSVLFDFTAAELSEIASGYRRKEEGNGLYGAVLAYRERGKDQVLRKKIDDFVLMIGRYRSLSYCTELPLLLRQLYRELNILNIVSAMAGGAQRERNLTALLNRASAFQETSYHGIFHFIRFIEKMEKSQVDTGEPGSAGEYGQAVRIMTIHKSKGLEFPVVFVSGLGKKINKRDSSEAVVLHPTDGFGIDCVDHEARLRRKTFLRKVLAEEVKTDSVGEELRVLYVALTRAKEKLYMTGVLKKRKKDAPLLDEAQFDRETGKLTRREILGASSMIDWILSAYRRNCGIGLNIVRTEDIIKSAAEGSVGNEVRRIALKETMLEPSKKAQMMKNEADRVFSYSYLYDDLFRLRPTLSVSALKMEHMELTQDDETQIPQEALFDDVPEEEKQRLKKKKQGHGTDGAWSSGGAALGTLYHFIMERMEPMADIKETLLGFLDEGLISSEEKDRINENRITRFWNSSVGQRFAAAYRQGKGFREKAFIIGLPAADIRSEMHFLRSPGELVMLQGIIDMYFEERGELILVDYKTDRVKTASELVNRYRTQLDLYARALEQITGKKVREKIIYSFSLEEEIYL